MPIEVIIEDVHLNNLSNGAKKELKTEVEKFALDIIKESNLLEESIRENGTSENIVNSSIILQVVRRRRMHYHKKRALGLILVKIISSLSLVFTGFLYDSSGYPNDSVKMIAFIVVLVIACVSTVLQFVFGDKE